MGWAVWVGMIHTRRGRLWSLAECCGCVGVLELSGSLDVFIHTASKYDKSQLLHVPRAVFR